MNGRLANEALPMAAGALDLRRGAEDSKGATEAGMTEHPILFSPVMVRALIGRRKTVTRRMSRQWLKVKAGDRLWVRETHSVFAIADDRPEAGVGYRANHPYGGDLSKGDGGYNWHRFEGMGSHEKVAQMVNGDRWRPSIHMPRWASRLTLECLEDAREERLQDITEEEAIRDGVDAVAMAHCCACHETFPDGAVVMHPSGADICPKCEASCHTCVYGEGWTCGCAEEQESGIPTPALYAFASLWSTLHTKPGERWTDNPSIVRIAFKVADEQ